MVDSGDGGRAGVTIDSRPGAVIIGPATDPAVKVEHISHEQTVGLERVGRQVVGAAGFAGKPFLDPRKIRIGGVEEAVAGNLPNLIQRFFFGGGTPPDAAHIKGVDVVGAWFHAWHVRGDGLDIQILGLWLARKVYGAGGAVPIAEQRARFQQAILVVVSVEGVG